MLFTYYIASDFKLKYVIEESFVCFAVMNGKVIKCIWNLDILYLQWLYSLKPKHVEIILRIKTVP